MSTTGIHDIDLPLQADDGHRFQLLGRIPAAPQRSLLWLPALGVAAKHYLPLADALARRGIAVFLHEWRGNGSSALRADRKHDWGYHELLTYDLATSQTAIVEVSAGIPRIIGGHSLGGQLACCSLALFPGIADALWLAASGSPYWRAFPLPQRALLPLTYRFLPWLAQVHGTLPGRHIGFGGNEARSLMCDWAHTATSGSYDVTSLGGGIQAAMKDIRVPVRAAVMCKDWLAPVSSLRYLLTKFPVADAVVRSFDLATLGVKADHFAWLRARDTVAAFFCDQDAASAEPTARSPGSSPS